MAKQTTTKINVEEINAASVDTIGGDSNAASVDSEDKQGRKIRAIPSDIATVDKAQEIARVIDAVKNGKPNNTGIYKGFGGYSVEQYQTLVGDKGCENCAVDCIFVEKPAKSRKLVLFTAINDKPYIVTATTNTQKLIPELVKAGKKGKYAWGYSESYVRSLSNASTEDRKLIGGLSFNHFAENNFCLCNAVIRDADLKWVKKNQTDLYNLFMQIKENGIPENATVIEYTQVKSLIDYKSYLRGVLVDSDTTENQKISAREMLAKIG